MFRKKFHSSWSVLLLVATVHITFTTGTYCSTILHMHYLCISTILHMHYLCISTILHTALPIGATILYLLHYLLVG